MKVNHLPHDITEDDVTKLFDKFGSLASVVVKKGTGECYAFVNFHSSLCALEAATQMNDRVVGEKTIKCKAQSEPERQRRSSSVGDYTLKVTHISKQTSEASLSSLFSLGSSNTIESLRIVPTDDRFNYAYVNYFSQVDAEAAATRLDGKLVDSSEIKVRAQFDQVGQPSLAAQVSARPSPAIQVPTGLSAVTQGYSRSYSSVPQATHPLSPVQRQFSHPVTHVPRSPTTLTSQSHTVKVSIFGELSPDDIAEVFGEFGPLRDKPIIRGCDPFFAFVNFRSPDAATKSVANLQNSTIKQVRILCRVHVPQSVGPNIDSEDVRCSSLAASILNSKCKEELGRLESEHKVKVTPKPSSDCLRVLGGSEHVAAVKVCLESLLERVEGDIAEEECDLPCHSVPLFEQGAAVEKFKKIEENHGVEFQVLKSPDDTPTQLASFSQEVKNCFDPQQSADKIPECSELASYMREEIQSASTSQPGTTWLWQNDSASGFIPYSSDTAAELSTAFSACPSGVTALKIGAYTYLIDFPQMTQTNISSGRSRPIRQASSSSLSVQWFYQNDEREFSPYAMEQSDRIETMFQSNAPGLMYINENVYTFDFNAMKQSNVVSLNTRKIERRVEISEDENTVESVEHVLTLQARGLPDSLEPALKELKETVERATVVKECRLNTDCSNGFKARLVKNMNKYFVTTELVDDCLKLKGMPRYVERVHLLAEQEKIADREQQIQDGAGGMELPAHWSPQSEEVCLYKVQRNSDEWKKEVASIQKTLDEAAVVKLERIQNEWLWERYSFAKKQMSKKNKGCVNEKHLFHGTRTTPPEKVFRSEKGVDFRFSRKGLWGMGSYFAVNASYSDRYAYNATALGSNERQMLICKVLTGDSYNAEAKTDESLRQPPLKPVPTHGSFEEERYDSVKGNTSGSYVYVVYDHEKMYPAYLVTYKVV